VKEVKGKVRALIADFMTTEEVEDVIASINDLHCPALHYEVIQTLLRTAFDRSNRQRELASRFLCYTQGSLFSAEAVEQAFSILLQRVEDVYLDVPDVLHLLSVFIARAVVDEALQPSFLSRVDLDERDLGAQVLVQAEKLLEGEGRVERMEKCWRGEREGRKGTTTPPTQNGKRGVDERKEFTADTVDDSREEVKR